MERNRLGCLVAILLFLGAAFVGSQAAAPGGGASGGGGAAAGGGGSGAG